MEVGGQAVRYELADLLDQVANAGDVLGRGVRIAAGHSHGGVSQRDQGAAHARLQALDGGLRRSVALDHLGPRHQPVVVRRRPSLRFRGQSRGGQQRGEHCVDERHRVLKEKRINQNEKRRHTLRVQIGKCAVGDRTVRTDKQRAVCVCVCSVTRRRTGRCTGGM